MIYLGIDPGKKGAIACFGPNGYEVIPMPATTRQICSTLDIFIGCRPCKCVIEQVQVMGKAFGAKAALSYGQGYGEIIGILTALEAEIHEVRASVWKKKLNLDKDKNNSILLCERLFPQINLIPGRCQKPQDGLAEAALLLHYGRQFLFR